MAKPELLQRGGGGTKLTYSRSFVLNSVHDVILIVSNYDCLCADIETNGSLSEVEFANVPV